jgi:predicted NBD/HSP70 family sugar kinase
MGTPGRPSPVVGLNPRAAVVLALEIEVDSLGAALVGLGGTIFDIARVDRSRGHTSVDEIAADLVRLAASVRRRHPDLDPVIGIGVAIVGVVRRRDGLVAMAPNLGWLNVPLGERLALAFGDDGSVPIAVANEADLGALAEARRGAAVGVDDVVFLSGEVGVGSGIIVDGHPLTGAAGFGGEVGHMPVNPVGTPCRCGSYGCWETEVGDEALLLRAGHPRDGGRNEVEAVIREAAAGSGTALGALNHVGRWLGVGLAALVNILNPRLIVLGGRFARIHPYVIDAIDDELARRALPASRALIRIVPATMGVDASLLGAAELAFEPLLNDPASWLDRTIRAPGRGTACA